MVFPFNVVLAAVRGELDTLKSYFEPAGASKRDPNESDDDGWSCLMRAAGNPRESSIECVKYLLSMGADVSHRFNKDLNEPEGSLSMCALDVACHTKRGSVIRLLIDAGAANGGAINLKSQTGRYGMTPLGSILYERERHNHNNSYSLYFRIRRSNGL